MKQEKLHLGTITILIKDRVTHAGNVNQILGKHGDVIVARLGVNVDRTRVKGLRGLITVAVEGTADDINALNKELDELYGIVAKRAIMTE